MIPAISSKPVSIQTATLAAAPKLRFGQSAESYPQSLFGEEPVVRTGFFRNLFNWFANLIAPLLPDTVTKADSYNPGAALDLTA